MAFESVEASSTEGTVIVDFDFTLAVPDAVKHRVEDEVVGDGTGT